MYKLDPISQFRDMMSFKHDANPPKQERRKRGKQAKACDGDLSVVICQAAIAHFRRRFSAAAFYSCAPSVIGEAVPLEESLHSGVVALRAGLGDVGFLHDDGNMLDDSIRARRPRTKVASHRFFRVVHARPVVQNAVSRMMESDDMVINVRQPVQVDSQSSAVTLDLQPGDLQGQEKDGHDSMPRAMQAALYVLSIPKCASIVEQPRSVYEWHVSTARGISYEIRRSKLAALRSEQVVRATALLDEMVRVGALPGDHGHDCPMRLVHAGREADLQLLEALGREGLVSCTRFAGDHCAWSLTRGAVDDLQLHLTVCKPRGFFDGRSPPPPHDR